MDMARVLIVEDETVLRASLAHGLSKTSGMEVRDAGSVDQALSLIDKGAPDIIISDIDLPGRTGIELLGELGKRGLSIPIVYVSAYLKAYGAQIPQHANIEVLEKPIALEELRRVINDKLAARDEDEEEEPFSVPDFLQLAGMGRRTLVIEAQWGDGEKGSVVVHGGEVWSAELGALTGIEAFAQLAWRTGAHVRCRNLTGELGPRTLQGTAEGLLMDTARMMDEQNRDAGGSSHVERATNLSSRPPRMELLSEEDEFNFAETFPPTSAAQPAPPSEASSIVDDAFGRQLDRGVSALLKKDYETALAAFEAALAIQPEHPLVKANLERLHEMGYGNQE